MNIIEHPSPNQDERSMPIGMVVLHYTGMRTGAEAIARLSDPAAKVSAHWVVAEDGTILRLVPEERRAWHAGRSWWRGIVDCNSASIGIEIVNPGHEFGYVPFPPAQMDSVAWLVAGAMRKYGIKPANVVGHSDVAPTRKDDPGELFDWPWLAAQGLAAPVPKADVDPGWTDAGFVAALARYGYEIQDPVKSIIAFQRRFRPRLLDGRVDAECRAILWGLLRAEGL